jgi:hypothetical protein
MIQNLRKEKPMSPAEEKKQKSRPHVKKSLQEAGNAIFAAFFQNPEMMTSIIEGLTDMIATAHEALHFDELQELSSKIDTQQSVIETLQAKLAELEGKLPPA